MDSRARAWITMPASAGASVIRSAPDAIVPRGSRPNASQSARPSGSTRIRSRSMRRPTPAASASSTSAVAIPPSVGSCIACTVTNSHAISASGRTLSPGVLRNPLALRMAAGETPRARSSVSFSRAMMAAPSSGTPLVITTASPTRAPPVVTSLSFSTSPSIVPATIGRSRPCVISVWPPTRATSSSSQAAWSSVKSASTDASLVAPAGSSSVARNHRGRAPRTAMSFALTCSAYHPISAVANVMGSLVATRYRSPMSMTAASSPSRGPTTTRGSVHWCLSKIACSVSARSLPIGRDCMPTGSIHCMSRPSIAAPAVECVPNVSEGRDHGVIERLADAIRSVGGVTLMNVHADADHHRTVFSFLGAPACVEAAALALAARAVELIDLRRHRGVPPRVGALGVLPFVPLAGISMAGPIPLARRVGESLASRHALPVYYYGAAATRPGRRTPRALRRGEYEGLAARLASADGAPDAGPARFDARTGAVLVGARDILVAFNVWLASGEVAVAREIARAVRESSGGLPALQAMGVLLASRGIAQVSMNLLDSRATSIAAACDRVRDEARARGVAVSRSELVGVALRAAFAGRTPESVGLAGFTPDLYLDTYLEPGAAPLRSRA